MFDAAVLLWANRYVYDMDKKDKVISLLAASIVSNYLQPGSRLRLFYAGSCIGESMNNCGLESANKQLKEATVTSVSLDVFTKHIKEHIANYSDVRSPNYPERVEFKTTPHVTNDTWLYGEKIVSHTHMEHTQANYRIVQTTEEPPSYVIFDRTYKPEAFSGNETYCQDECQRIVTCFRKHQYSNIGTFYKFVSVDNFVYLNDSNKAWYCHCECHAREHICVHTIAVQIYLNELTPPMSLWSFYPSCKRKRKVGRPRTTYRHTTPDSDSHLDDNDSVAPTLSYSVDSNVENNDENLHSD